MENPKNLRERRCVPCQAGTPKLGEKPISELLRQIEGWQLAGEKLRKQYRFADFRAAMKFVGEMAEEAEREQHHPLFTVDYSRVDVVLWTHKIGGLSENDFILAAKIDALPSAREARPAGK